MNDLLEFLGDVQILLSKLLHLDKDVNEFEPVCALDVSYKGEEACACAVLLIDDEVQEVKNYRSASPFPYIPGFFSFREGPLMLRVLKLLDKRPKLILVDGHGIAHPRGMGLASFIGLISGIPTIGIAKSILVGRVEGEGPMMKIFIDGRHVGFEVKWKRRFYASPGDNISIESVERAIKYFSFSYPRALEEADRRSRECLK